MGCFTFITFMMIWFNLLIFLSGLTLLGMGIWVTVDQGSVLQNLESFTTQNMQLVNMGYFCITFGGALVLLGLLGYWGARAENRCLLLLYFSVILVIFIAEVAGGAMALVYSLSIKVFVKAWANMSLKMQYGSNLVVTEFWNSTMQQLSCCGLSNYTDFTDAYYCEKRECIYPPSCCQLEMTSCSMAQAKISAVQGCFEELLSTLRNNNILGIAAAAVGGLEVSSMVLSMALFCYLEKNDTLDDTFLLNI